MTVSTVWPAGARSSGRVTRPGRSAGTGRPHRSSGAGRALDCAPVTTRRAVLTLVLAMGMLVTAMRIRGMRSLPDGDGWRPLEGPDFR